MPSLAVWSGLSRRRRLLVLVAVLVLLLAVGLTAVRLATGSSTTSGFPAQDRPGPVVLVPGYGGSGAALEVLAGRLRATGRTAEVLALPGDGTGDLLAQVAALDGAVGRALATGAPSVDVVGYSAGGVVTRLWVADDAGAHKARRVVTLGSPLHGTEIAALGTSLVPGACPVACQQLVPGGALLRQVDAQTLPPQLPWLSLWTQDDQTVTPPDSARLAGAVNVVLQQVCPGRSVAHGQLPTDPLSAGIVLSALNSPAVRAPAATQCADLVAAGQPVRK